MPVGVDQAPHLEFARETVRSFNYRYNSNMPDRAADESHRTAQGDRASTGSQKMSKSLDNHIELAATPEETTRTGDEHGHRPGSVSAAATLATRMSATSSTLHKIFSSPEEVAMVNTECRRAGIGCVQCKQLFARNLNQHLDPFRLRRNELDKNPGQVWDVLREGQQRARNHRPQDDGRGTGSDRIRIEYKNDWGWDWETILFL